MNMTTLDGVIWQALQIPATAVINSEAAKLDYVAKAGSATRLERALACIRAEERALSNDNGMW